MSLASWHFASAASVSSISLRLSSTSRMGRRSAIDASSTTRNGKTECGALVDHAARFDPSAMTLNDAAGECEANACADELLHAMQALEHSKQLVHVRHVEADAVVAHGI